MSHINYINKINAKINNINNFLNLQIHTKLYNSYNNLTLSIDVILIINYGFFYIFNIIYFFFKN